MIQKLDKRYVTPDSFLIDFQPEGIMCLSNIGANHGGFENGGDIEIELNININE